MSTARLYFLSDQYYHDFSDNKLMKNKDTIDGVSHWRPCFYAFADSRIPDIYWLVPISSQYAKFKRIEQNKIAKYGKCNTIRFGQVLGRDAAFLIQNMCPTTLKYLTVYVDKNNQPVQIDGRIAADVERNAREVLAIARRGVNVIYPDVFAIYQGLERQLQETT